MAENNEANSGNMSSTTGTEEKAIDLFPPEKADDLEDLFATLNQKIHASNWLQENTPEKFEKENPEVARMFRELREKEKQKEDEKEQGSSNK